MISLVIDFCFNILSQCWTFLTSIELIPGVSLMSFCLGLVVISVVIFGLISTVKVSSGYSVGRRRRLSSNSSDHKSTSDSSSSNPSPSYGDADDFFEAAVERTNRRLRGD